MSPPRTRQDHSASNLLVLLAFAVSWMLFLTSH
ncbi:hypothetical protein NC652_009885 [Populus alba x Populus x berolinensis]|uniref:Uncharacterized protein n=1 Tax=Populus alba x Populus x berolinensis TaxID=444605 RepID=A0AAD6RAN7_9ROSI|nr:hypothetical protein NC652_009885 [Populus alba x Populus x berolinensis]KAJ7005253.1 hypothetical protein NC653_009910 [Populus alba x Populus x berolinensis]